MIRVQQSISSSLNNAQTSIVTSTPELTPLIDIVFIVVVFLLLTANARILSLPVDIPGSDSEITSTSIKSRSLTIAIRDNSPFWYIHSEQSTENRTYPKEYESWQDVKAVLQNELEASPSLIIAPDADSNTERLVQLLAFLNENNFSDAHIVMEPK